MFVSILCLLLLFICGLLMSTNYFPKKIILDWFHEILGIVKNKNNYSSHAAVSSSNRAGGDGVNDKKKKKIESNSVGAVCNNSKDEIRSIFATFDKNSDGFITKQELRDSLRNIGMAMDDKDIADIITNLDSNGDGLIDLDEFCESFASLLGREEMSHKVAGSRDDNSPIHEEEQLDNDGALKEAFDVFDEDKDGLITVEELGLVLSSLGFREENKVEDCKKMITKVDIDGDGMVNFDEFKIMMRAGL